MTRRLLNLLTLASLLLCGTATAAWIRSHWATDTVRLSGSGGDVRIVFTRGAAVAAWRSGEGLGQALSIVPRTDDRPWEPDYRRADNLFGPGQPPTGPPPGSEWVAEPFDSFRSVRLELIVLACGALPAARLIRSRVRRLTRAPQSTVAGDRLPRRRLARLFLGGSWMALVVAVIGWIDSATWHYQNLAWRAGELQLVSNWGRCELIVDADWSDWPTPDESPYLSAPNVRRRGALTWHREWLLPSGRAHSGPAEPALFPWFQAALFRANHTSVGGLFGGAPPTGPLPSVSGFTVRIPYWSVTVLAAVLPARSLWRWRRSRRRQRAGLCPRCGYNLTGNTTGVCPECGAAITGVP
jgi:hypothetical protein